MSENSDRGKHVGTFILGMLLLVLGVLLLMSRAGVFNFNLTRIGAIAVAAAGAYASVSAFASSNQRRLFWGSVVFLVGLLLLLVSYHFIPDSWNRLWPSAMIIPGLAFLMLFFSNPREFALLVIAALFVAGGWASLLTVKGDFQFSDSILGTLRIAIPVIVVIAGLYLIWKNFLRSQA